MNYDEFLVGYHHAELTFVSMAAEAARLISPHPPMAAVVEPVVVTGDICPRMIAPTLREHAAAVAEPRSAP